MKTLRVTYGGWVSLEATMVLNDADHDALRAALEHDDPVQRMAARDSLRQRLQRTHPAHTGAPRFEDCEIEALDFIPAMPHHRAPEPADQAVSPTLPA